MSCIATYSEHFYLNCSFKFITWLTFTIDYRTWLKLFTLHQFGFNRYTTWTYCHEYFVSAQTNLFTCTHPILQSLGIVVMNLLIYLHFDTVKIFYYIFLKQQFTLCFLILHNVPHTYETWFSCFWNIPAACRHCEVHGRIINKHLASFLM